MWNYRLSPREDQLLELALRGCPRSRLYEVMGVSENTVKTQVRGLLRKTKQPSLEDLVWSLRRHEFIEEIDPYMR